MSASSIDGTKRDDDIETSESTPEAEAEARATTTEGDEPYGAADPDPIHYDHPEDEHAHQGSSFAATALKMLIFVLVIFGLSLWLVPMVAPQLPAGIARHLMPGQVELDQRLAALQAQIETSTAQISSDVSTIAEEVSAIAQRLEAAEETARSAEAEAAAARAAAEESAGVAEQSTVAESVVARAETAAREASELADTATTAATEAGKVASAATRDTASLARRMTDFEASLASLSDQIEAVNERLAAGTGEGGAAAPELAAAYSSLKAQVDALEERLGAASYVTATEAERFATQDDLRSARTALEASFEEALAALPEAQQIVVDDELDALRTAFETKVGEIVDRVAAIEGTAEEAAEEATAAELAASAAVAKVSAAIRDASLRSAAAALASRLENGVPYAGALGEIERLVDVPPPEELAAPADTGVATAEELIRRFGQPAQEAIAADIRARAGDGLLARAGARVRSVVAGRPANEEEGDDAAAILSRVEARLRSGELAEALAEAEALPPGSQEALGDWLADLRRRVEAAEAAEAYVGAATGSEG